MEWIAHPAKRKIAMNTIKFEAEPEKPQSLNAEKILWANTFQTTFMTFMMFKLLTRTLIYP
jgi:hypothetical protein